VNSLQGARRHPPGELLHRAATHYHGRLAVGEFAHDLRVFRCLRLSNTDDTNRNAQLPGSRDRALGLAAHSLAVVIEITADRDIQDQLREGAQCCFGVLVARGPVDVGDDTDPEAHLHRLARRLQERGVVEERFPTFERYRLHRTELPCLRQDTTHIRQRHRTTLPRNHPTRSSVRTCNCIGTSTADAAPSVSWPTLPPAAPPGSVIRTTSAPALTRPTPTQPAGKSAGCYTNAPESGLKRAQ